MKKSERLERDGCQDPILFYNAHNEAGELSQFSHHAVTLINPWTLKRQHYKSAEHRFQAMKATCEEDHDAVANTVWPRDAKIVGRSIQLRDDWGQDRGCVCWYVMFEACIAKALQHKDVLDLLFKTDMRHIYEDSSRDDIWGWRKGVSYHGKNLLGECWMSTRQLLLC